jgi:hypothetical protein
MGATAGNAGVAVAYKSPVETPRNGVVNEMMDHAVPKLGRPDLPYLRVRHDKGEAASDFVIPACKVPVERYEIGLQIGLEPKLVDGIPLGPSAIEVGVEYGL